MWWRSPTLPILALALALGGCGFHPLYSQAHENTQIRQQLSGVHVSPIDERNGQILYNALMERMHTDESVAQPRYRLQITLEENMGGINYQKNATASGGEMQISANWQLLDVTTGRRVDSGKFSTVDSVNFLGPRYASVVAERDAERRILENLSDLITDRVAIYLTSHKQQ